jgi:hypothetical protein
MTNWKTFDIIHVLKFPICSKIWGKCLSTNEIELRFFLLSQVSWGNINVMQLCRIWIITYQKKMDRASTKVSHTCRHVIIKLPTHQTELLSICFDTFLVRWPLVLSTFNDFKLYSGYQVQCEKKCGFKGNIYENNITVATYGQELLSLLQHLSSPQFLVVFELLDL